MRAARKLKFAAVHELCAVRFLSCNVESIEVLRLLFALGFFLIAVAGIEKCLLDYVLSILHVP